MSELVIREIGTEEFPRAWPVFKAVIAEADTYSYPPDLTLDQACAMWTTPPVRCFIAERAGEVLGCYNLRPNQPGLGDHVANCGYMVAPSARGQGIAAAMCAHSLDAARRTGFRAMQFNFVAASNSGAIRLWQRHGFAIVGTVPGAFRHATLGPTDIHIMHRTL